MRTTRRNRLCGERMKRGVEGEKKSKGEKVGTNAQLRVGNVDACAYKRQLDG